MKINKKQLEEFIIKEIKTLNEGKNKKRGKSKEKEDDESPSTKKEPGKFQTITLTQGEIQDAMKHRVHKDKKKEIHRNRKHKNNKDY